LLRIVVGHACGEVERALRESRDAAADDASSDWLPQGIGPRREVLALHREDFYAAALSFVSGLVLSCDLDEEHSGGGVLVMNVDDPATLLRDAVESSSAAFRGPHVPNELAAVAGIAAWALTESIELAFAAVRADQSIDIEDPTLADAVWVYWEQLAANLRVQVAVAGLSMLIARMKRTMAGLGGVANPGAALAQLELVVSHVELFGGVLTTPMSPDFPSPLGRQIESVDKLRELLRDRIEACTKFAQRGGASAGFAAFAARLAGVAASLDTLTVTS
jgi:hypothetical protein